MFKQISKFIVGTLGIVIVLSAVIILFNNRISAQTEPRYEYFLRDESFHTETIEDLQIIRHTTTSDGNPVETPYHYSADTHYQFVSGAGLEKEIIKVSGDNPEVGRLTAGNATTTISLGKKELFEEMVPDPEEEGDNPGDIKVTVAATFEGGEPDPESTVVADVLTLRTRGGEVLKTIDTDTPPLSKNPVEFEGTFTDINPGKYRICSEILRNATAPRNTNKNGCKNIELVSGSIEEILRGTVDYDSLETVDVVGDGINCKSNGSLGWIFCGVIGFAQETIDVAKNFIVSYLETAPLNTKGDLFESWKGIRTLANVLLIPVFFMIIFSQALSLNIDAYTIKKMLPRLIAATILIQFSFYFVALALDITNVLGNGLGNLLAGSFKSSNIIDITPNNFVSGIALGGLVLGTIGAVATGLLFTLMIPFLLAILGVLFTLIFRTVLIAMLAMLAPIAFAAWVLPNTEKLFKLWWNTLLRVLMMYPLITALFAAGTIAAGLLSGDDVQIKGVGQDTVSDIAAIAALIVPLALVPFTFKVAGGVMGMVGGQIDKLRRGVTRDKQGKARPWYQKRLQRGADQFSDIRGGGKGRTMRALFNPQSFAPGSIPLPGGRRIGIPILGKMGADARGGILEQWNAKRKGASKNLDDLDINNAAVLKGLVNAGEGQGALRKYINDQRTLNTQTGGREGITAVQGRMLEKVHTQAGPTAVQAAAAVKLAGSGQIEYQDIENLRQSMQHNAPAFEETLGDIASEARKNGRPDLSAFKTNTNSTGTSVNSVQRDDAKIGQNILRMNEEAIGGIRNWGEARPYFDAVLSAGGDAANELRGNLRRTLASGGVSPETKEEMLTIFRAHGIDERPPTPGEEQAQPRVY